MRMQQQAGNSFLHHELDSSALTDPRGRDCWSLPDFALQTEKSMESKLWRVMSKSMLVWGGRGDTGSYWEQVENMQAQSSHVQTGSRSC